MNNSIQQIEQEYIRNIEKHFSSGKKINIKEWETYFLREAETCAGKMTAAYTDMFLQ